MPFGFQHENVDLRENIFSEQRIIADSRALFSRLYDNGRKIFVHLRQSLGVHRMPYLGSKK
jgi:hypothetical protein